ncbi:acyl-CoA thioesterase [Nonomuraea lactucae]|uniref:acyl-CoA thioesterase n=1 Tax=Nonomuraea lactucae TaxID=2249762 RepID=UPI0019667FE7|nr:thioesterase family protein [Nonomuraea lactucae]
MTMLTTMLAVSRRVEHVDTDASGVVHFARYPSLLETAALENLDRLGVGLAVLSEAGLDLAVTELAVRYLTPARFLDRVSVEIGVEHVGAVRFRLSGAVLRAPDATPLVTGTLTFCAVDRATGAASALPGRLKDLLKECRHHAAAG